VNSFKLTIDWFESLLAKFGDSLDLIKGTASSSRSLRL
jgi:hypothetical protein